jgi:choline dehydrogenase-like flavoprotein
MIVYPHEFENGQTLRSDICVIGSGAAGISLALELNRMGIDTLVIAGGGYRQTEEDSQLYQADMPLKFHEPLDTNRCRIFGGTTALWSGRCISFDEIDFEKRDWVGNLDWPVSYTELTKFFGRAAEICEIGSSIFSAAEAFPHQQKEIISGFGRNFFSSDRLERWSPPTRFGRRYHSELKSSASVKVLLDAHCVELVTNDARSVIEKARCISHARKELLIESRFFVLCAGTLENARILLASNRQVPEGLGNERGLVGRYYMSHLWSYPGALVFDQPNENVLFDFEIDAMGVYCRRRFWVRPEIQRKHKIANTVVFFISTDSSVQHQDPLTSLRIVGRKFKTAVLLRNASSARKELTKDWSSTVYHLKNVGKAFFRRPEQYIDLLYRRVIAQRKMPMILGRSNHLIFPLCIQSEQAPSFSSRVYLGRNLDSLGMPRLIVEPRYSDVDRNTIRTTVDLIAHACREFPGLRFQPSYENQDDFIDAQFSRFNSGAHQIGTTRMGTSPDNGVVDSNSKVFGLDNLFISGPSVFASSSHANPVFMTVALSVRLAEILTFRARQVLYG